MPAAWSRGQKLNEPDGRLCLLDEAGFDRLDRHPDALGAAVRGLDSDPLKVGAELALRDAGHVRADAAALLRLTLAIDDRALDGTATGDCTDSSHDGFELVKGSEVKVGTLGWQGETWSLAAAERISVFWTGSALGSDGFLNRRGMNSKARKPRGGSFPGFLAFEFHACILPRFPGFLLHLF